MSVQKKPTHKKSSEKHSSPPADGIRVPSGLGIAISIAYASPAKWADNGPESRETFGWRTDFTVLQTR
ncbi:hypothetical protein [Pseudomonas sp. CLCA07]